MSGNKRKKSIGSASPDPVASQPKKQRQSTLLSSFLRIDKAVAIATKSGGGSFVDLTKQSASDAKQQASGGGSQPSKSAAFVDLCGGSMQQATAQSSLRSVTHVSDTYKPRSMQGSAAAVTGGSAADDACSPQLCPEQEHVLRVVRSGRNVFFTGNAGTGKTFMLNQIVDDMRRKYGRDFGVKVALAAPTGIAATHIQGDVRLSEDAVPRRSRLETVPNDAPLLRTRRHDPQLRAGYRGVQFLQGLRLDAQEGDDDAYKAVGSAGERRCSVQWMIG